MKKFLAVFLLFGALAATALLYFQPWNKNHQHYHPSTAIPKSVPLFGTIPNFSALLTKIDTLHYGSQITNAPWFQAITASNLLLNQAIFQLDSTKKIQDYTPYFAIANGGSGTPAILQIVDISPFINQEIMVEQLLPANATSYLFDGNTIYRVPLQETEYAIAILNNLLIASAHAPLVEEALKTAKEQQSPTLATNFQQLLSKQAATGEMQLFLHYASISTIASIFAPQNQIPTFAAIEEVGEWTNLQVHFHKDQVAFTGYSSYVDSTSMLYKLEGSLPTSNELANFLPSNTAYFNRVNGSGSKLLQSTNSAEAYFSSWADGAYAHFILETFDNNFRDRGGLIIAAKDADLALENLKEYAKTDLEFVDSVQGNAIYKLTDAAPLNQVYPNSLFQFQEAYFTIYQSKVFFATNIGVVKTCLQKNLEGNVLGREITYTDFIETISSKSNVQTYCMPNRMSKAMATLLKPAYLNPEAVQKFSWQLSNVNGKYFTTGLISYKKNSLEKTNQLWETTLEKPARMQAQLVLNHKDGSNELITQDEANNLYLLNSSGEIQFTKAIDGEIMGKVHQIDFYKNGKLQYVFNTATDVYLIDRLGNAVADFPRKLPAEATAPMLVARYDGQGKYRYFVSCANGKVYGFEPDFTPLNGWSPVASHDNVSSAISHRIISAKDYIYYCTEKGDFYAYSRNGTPRFETVQCNANFRQKFALSEGSFLNGAAGKLYKITSDGVLSVVPMVDTTYHSWQLVPNTGSLGNVYAWTSDKSFKLVKNEVQVLASYDVPETIESMEVVDWNAEKWFLIRTATKDYMIDTRGSLHPDFPKIATAPVVAHKLYKNKEPVFILGDEDSKLKALELKVAN